MSQFTIVPSVKFEILLPATYIDPTDPTETPRFVQRTEQETYHQAEILAYHYAVNRYVPAPSPNF